MTAMDLDQLRKRRDAMPGGRLAFVAGQFNVVHPGHIRLLKFARSLADELVVGLLPDSSGAYIPLELRLAAVTSLEMVGHAFCMCEDLKNTVFSLRPDVMVKGGEHEARVNPEEEWLKLWGGRLVFCTDDPRFSLDDMVRGMLRDRGGIECMDIPAAYLERHGIAMERLGGILDKVAGLRVTVIGDLIIDEYVICSPLGMSREDPTLVVSPLEETRFIGGAGIVAGHAAGLGATVDFVSLAGEDAAAEYAGEWFAKQGIRTHMLSDPNRPTTVKRRYKAQNKTLLRVNRLSQQYTDREQQQQCMDMVFALLPKTDLVIFSDFSYGMLPSHLVEELIRKCHSLDIPMTADSQTSSQIGDLAKFHDMLLLTPTEVEARHAVHNFTQGLVAMAEELRGRIKARHVIVTLGADGCLIQSDPARYTVFTDNLPAMNPRPLDVAGAGDSFLTTASVAMAAGADIWQAALLGSIAAGVQVERMGNIPLCREEILRGMGGRLP